MAVSLLSRQGNTLQRALLLGCALFFVAVFAGTVSAQVSLPAVCVAPGYYHGMGKVWHVHDGDTVSLENRTRIRLIGLDTPEIFWRDKDAPAEPFAHEARDALMELLHEHDYQVRWVYDREPEDRYRRVLAHLFTPEGESITALLLAQGLGYALTIPPNNQFIDCYRATERQAMEDGLGIWSLPEFALLDAETFPADAKGFRRVQGRVQRIGESNNAYWLNLEGQFAVRIDRADLEYFPDLQFNRLRGATISARGLVFYYRGEPRIRVRHAADLEITYPPSN